MPSFNLLITIFVQHILPTGGVSGGEGAERGQQGLYAQRPEANGGAAGGLHRADDQPRLHPLSQGRRPLCEGAAQAGAQQATEVGRQRKGSGRRCG